MVELPYTEPAFIAYLKGEEAAPFIENPHVRFSTSGSKDFLHSSLSPFRLEKEQLTVPPTVGRQAETKVELTVRCKENGEIIPLSATHSKNEFATRTPGTEKKAKPKVKSRLISSSHMDVCAPTPPVKEKAKGKVMPPLSPSCHVHHKIRAPGKAKDPEHSSSGVVHSSQESFVNVTGDSQGIASCETNEKSSAEEQVFVVPTTSRVKQTKNEQGFEQIGSLDDHAAIERTQNMLSASRDVSLNVIVASDITRNQQKAERNIHVSSKPMPTEFVARQTHLAEIRQSEQVVAEEPPLMEVVKSALSAERLSTGHPETMETEGEQRAVTISFGEAQEAKQQSESASFIEQIEPMEIDQEPCENQEPVSEDSSFGVWATFVQPFFAQPPEEMMETDQESLVTTPSDVQLEIMETTQKLADAFTPVAIPFGETDAKRPLSSTMGVLQEESMLLKTPIAEQALTQSVMKPATVCMAPEQQCCMQPDAPIYNKHPQEMKRKLKNRPSFAMIEQYKSVAGETDQLKSTNQLTMEQQQLVPEVCSDSDSDDDSDGEYDLGLGEQVLLIIELLAGKELSSE